jgi:hypothetical protein
MKRCLQLMVLLAFPLMADAELVWERTEVREEASLVQSGMEAVFPFRNNGDEVVTITRLGSSCGCTVPELEKRDYAPGEGGEIKALFSFGSRQGPQVKRVTVSAVDEVGRRSQQTLTLRTEIPAWADLSPRILRWELGSDGAAREVRLRIDHPEQIRGPEVVAQPDHFTLERVDPEPGLILYRIRPVATDERLTERIAFQLAVEADGEVHTRQLAFHCLVR